jgi:deoxyribodipyrimidine photolyase-related protein
MPKIVRLILGDQLHEGHSWFSQTHPDSTYFMMEIRQETDYVRHHVQKVCAIFTAMRLFAEKLQSRGHKVEYWALDHPENRQSLTENLTNLATRLNAERIEYLEPDEFRLDAQLQAFSAQSRIPCVAVGSEHFLTDRTEVARFFGSSKSWRMELFYRKMRQKWDILMHGDVPEGGKWNFDAENRNPIPKGYPIPEGPVFQHDVSALVRLLSEHQVATMGNPVDILDLPLTREEALRQLAFFCETCLPHFGTFQDAMQKGYSTLFHARLSFSMNVKLIGPMEVMEAAIARYRDQPDRIALHQVEGFIRQILGWREYIRGMYWGRMPDLKTENYFSHQRPLPSWYWTGETRMECMRLCLGQSLDTAYAHHIQRLMVIGNFSLLAGLHPDEVDAWYLGVYADAFEWVELPNTRGMSQYADGGKTASKPYVSSGQYIRKMSNYCPSCAFDVTKKTGKNACPFNSLYWSFFEENRNLLQSNARIGMVYPTLNRFSPEDKKALLEQGAYWKNNLEELGPGITPTNGNAPGLPGL